MKRTRKLLGSLVVSCLFLAVLLPGTVHAETSLMWRPLIPALAERFFVIAPDLPGIGDSAIPPTVWI